MAIATEPAISGTCFLLGASGFVGRHVAATFAAKGWHVLAGVRHPTVVEGATSVLLDGSDETALATAISGRRIDVIVNLAGYGVNPFERDPLAMQISNVELAAAVVRYASTCGAAVVTAGSCAEYALPTGAVPVHENDLLETGKLYGASKAAGGLLAMATATALGVPLRHLRLFNVYGPGEAPHRLFPSLYAAKGSSARVSLSEGKQIRDFVFVADAADAMLQYAVALREGHLFGTKAVNLATGIGISVRVFAKFAARVIGLDPSQLGFGDCAMRPDEVPFLVGNPARLVAELCWSPAYDVEAGLEATLSVQERTRLDGPSVRASIS